MRGTNERAIRERMVFPLWRSLASVNLMLPKEDRKAMLLRLYNDDTPLQNNSNQRAKEKVEIKAKVIEEEEKEQDAAIRANSSSEDEAIDTKGGEGDVQDDPDTEGYIQLPAGDVEREAEMEVGLETGAIDEKYVAQQLMKDAS